jgi:hypothetical protein
MQDNYEATWRAKRMSAAQLIESHKTWQPMLQRWVRQARQNAEYLKQQEAARKLAAVVERLEPVPNWTGPCIIAPNGDIYPVTGSHEGTAGQVYPKLYPEQYRADVARRGYADCLETLCAKFGWARVSWYGEITKAYWSEKPQLSQAQIDALTEMATQFEGRLTQKNGEVGMRQFGVHLLESLALCTGDRVAVHA